MFYSQCLMQRKTSATVMEMIAWIPEKFAVVGKILRLKSRRNTERDGWKVISVGELRDSKYVLDHERDYLLTRKASDI